MQIYSTKFKVADTFTPEAFKENILEWNQTRNHPAEYTATSELSFITGDDDNYIEVNDLSTQKIIAARIHDETVSGIWDIDFVLNYGTHAITARIDRSFSEKTLSSSFRAYMPAFIAQIIDKGYAGMSNTMKICSKPVIASDDKLIDNILNSDDDCSLPVVWLSPASKINSESLALKLTGLAIVVNDINNTAADKIQAPVSVFFPNKNMETVMFGEYPLHREIQNAVHFFHNNREYSESETWNGVQNIRISDSNTDLLLKYKNLHSENSILEKMYDELEKKINDDLKQREQLISEYNKLTAENARLTHRLEELDASGLPALIHGSEEDMYPNEQRELLISILKDCCRGKVSVSEGTRRYDVVKSVIEANPVNDLPEKYHRIIKDAIEGYTSFNTAKIQKALKDTGIMTVEHSGHYKIALNGDHRYICTAAATCSDGGRGGKNLVSEINKKMF